MIRVLILALMLSGCGGGAVTQSCKMVPDPERPGWDHMVCGPWEGLK